MITGGNQQKGPTERKFGFGYLWKAFIYVSIIFLVIALYRADYLKIPEIRSFRSAVISFVCLFSGLLFNTLAWKVMLGKAGWQSGWSECVIGTGMSIFSKYIPGKIWLIVGRAAYIAQRHDYPLGKLSALSLNLQFLSSWVSALLGLIGIWQIRALKLWGIPLVSLIGFLSALIFSQALPKFINGIWSAISNKKRSYPEVPVSPNVLMIPWVAVNIILWSVGFYFLADSIAGADIPWTVGVGYPLAIAIGTISFITPGGLGIREGVAIAYMKTAGLTSVDAVTIAAASRLWFLMGEAFIFGVGLLANRTIKN